MKDLAADILLACVPALVTAGAVWWNPWLVGGGALCGLACWAIDHLD